MKLYVLVAYKNSPNIKSIGVYDDIGQSNKEGTGKTEQIVFYEDLETGQSKKFLKNNETEIIIGPLEVILRKIKERKTDANNSAKRCDSLTKILNAGH